eukprot:gnl/TRDRNA2_/TRDRNA2_93618_c0_seq1.p1 gnl/TRDRNA2_/TRDRNA2_93618_c0~~gnl/TRDRNA2_/TRDRNA2_93618_c0_seq1.p1  ORF type:complete len:193 (+),score=56.56 gnl/TRDRNA2_/TRDRNA2_93618_c0_seq1:66-581(+)
MRRQRKNGANPADNLRDPYKQENGSQPPSAPVSPRPAVSPRPVVKDKIGKAESDASTTPSTGDEVTAKPAKKTEDKKKKKESTGDAKAAPRKPKKEKADKKDKKNDDMTAQADDRGVAEEAAVESVDIDVNVAKGTGEKNLEDEDLEEAIEPERHRLDLGCPPHALRKLDV